MKKKSRGSEIAAFALFKAFENDDTIDADEFAILERLALEDGTVDAREKSVLKKVFARVSEDMVEPDVWMAIHAFRKRHGLD